MTRRGTDAMASACVESTITCGSPGPALYADARAGSPAPQALLWPREFARWQADCDRRLEFALPRMVEAHEQGRKAMVGFSL